MPDTLELRLAVNEPENVVHKVHVDSDGHRFSLEICNLDDAEGLRILEADESEPDGSRHCEHCFSKEEE